MEEILRFGVAYWHTFTEDLSDSFGVGTAIHPWNKQKQKDFTKARVEATFESFKKLNVPYFCFHDVDIETEGFTLRKSNQNQDTIIAMIKDYMKDSKTKLLWKIVNNFTHIGFVHGGY